jgi:hypothetical protein
MKRVSASATLGASAHAAAPCGPAQNRPSVVALLRRLREAGVELSPMCRRIRDNMLAAARRREERFTKPRYPGVELFLGR